MVASKMQAQAPARSLDQRMEALKRANDIRVRRPKLELAVSATTRAIRPGEKDGVDYWFVSSEEFERQVEAGAFLEHVVYVSGRCYGTLLSEVDRIAAKGKVCVLELETEGAREVH